MISIHIDACVYSLSTIHTQLQESIQILLSRILNMHIILAEDDLWKWQICSRVEVVGLFTVSIFYLKFYIQTLITLIILLPALILLSHVFWI